MDDPQFCCKHSSIQSVSTTNSSSCSNRPGLSGISSSCKLIFVLSFLASAKVVSGLAISDFWMAINFMGSTATQLAGRTLEGASCSLNGFATQWFVVQSMYFLKPREAFANKDIADYWVLMVAVCTFFMLADFKVQSNWIQSHRWVIWGLPWGLSAVWAGMGLGLSGYGNIGACKSCFESNDSQLTQTGCWFTKDGTRLLINFIPRWLIIVAILIIYTQLYFIIYRAHERFISMDEEASGSRQSVVMLTTSTKSAPSSDRPDVRELQDQRHRSISTIPRSRPAPTLKKVSIHNPFTSLISATAVLIILARIPNVGIPSCLHANLDRPNYYPRLSSYDWETGTISDCYSR